MIKSFSKKIPFDVLALSNNAQKMSNVLDELEQYKREQLYNAARANKVLLHSYEPYLNERIKEYGLPVPAEDYPLVLRQNLAFNAFNVMRYRGSVLGIRLFIQAATLGSVDNLDVVNYFPEWPFIFPSDIFGGGGYLPDSSQEGVRYLIDPDDEDINSNFSVTISTYFHDNIYVQQYLTRNILTMLPFYEGSNPPTINLVPGLLHGVELMSEEYNFARKTNNKSSIPIDVDLDIRTYFRIPDTIAVDGNGDIISFDSTFTSFEPPVPTQIYDDSYVFINGDAFNYPVALVDDATLAISLKFDSTNIGFGILLESDVFQIIFTQKADSDFVEISEVNYSESLLVPKSWWRVLIIKIYATEVVISQEEEIGTDYHFPISARPTYLDIGNAANPIEIKMGSYLMINGTPSNQEDVSNLINRVKVFKK